MKNIPNKIYLQIGDDTPKYIDFNDLDEVTWCADRISENDIEYIRVKNMDSRNNSKNKRL